jgi:hypothetical protein
MAQFLPKTAFLKNNGVVESSDRLSGTVKAISGNKIEAGACKR